MTSIASMPRASLSDIVSRYKVILVDNYGVLRNARKGFSASYQALTRLQKEGKDVFLFSNTASQTPAELQKELKRQGVELDEEHIITSGAALPLALQELGLQDKPLLCLGNRATKEYIEKARGRIVRSLEAEAAVMGQHASDCDEKSLEIFWSLCLEPQKKPALLLNPDSMVPVSEYHSMDAPGYGWKKLAENHPYNLICIGKPVNYMYRIAMERAGTVGKEEILAVGDCLDTDILGASDFGIDSLLVLSGLHHTSYGTYAGEFQYLPLSGLFTAIKKESSLHREMIEKGIFPTYALERFEY